MVRQRGEVNEVKLKIVYMLFPPPLSLLISNSLQHPTVCTLVHIFIILVNKVYHVQTVCT